MASAPNNGAVGMPQLDFSTFPNQIFWLVIFCVILFAIVKLFIIPRMEDIFANRRKIIDGKDITKGDVVLGLASSGIHSNGFSLFRKVRELNLDAKSKPSNEEALRPTKIYVKSILAAIKEYQVNGISHITGGGLTNNIPRIMPKGLCAKINLDSWLVPEIFTWLAEAGPIKEAEMLRTFNCGIGMVLIVPPDEAQGISKKLTYE